MAFGTETHGRSIVKALAWRVLGLFILFGISYAYDGNVMRAMTVGLVFNGIRLVLYYFHERMWNRIEWGIKPPS
ncbi:MAG: DUF2061 domain-containing protein, partial [Phycisphaerae bacterium]|nr:DUF2061 domain-containing protein [Phycisphaerae bacterium]